MPRVRQSSFRSAGMVARKTRSRLVVRAIRLSCFCSLHTREPAGSSRRLRAPNEERRLLVHLDDARSRSCWALAFSGAVVEVHVLEVHAGYA